MFQSFAIVPAAGASRRMGRCKLLLPWQGRPLIEHVLQAWVGSRVTRVIVVVRPDEAELHVACRRFNVDVVAPEVQPHDMKASVGLALAHIERRYQPAANDAWLVAPADMPQLRRRVIDQLLDAYDGDAPIALRPAAGGSRHPVVIPWFAAAEIARLPPERGVDALVDRLAIREVKCSGRATLRDIDGPDDYARLIEEDIEWVGGRR